jgi:hypothetical protein
VAGSLLREGVGPVRIAVWLSIAAAFVALVWFQRDRDHLSEAKVTRVRKAGL